MCDQIEFSCDPCGDMPCFEMSQEQQPMCEQENAFCPPSCEQCCVQPTMNANSFAEDGCEINYEMEPSCQPQLQSPRSYEYQPCPEESFNACDPYGPCPMPCEPFNTCQTPCNPCPSPCNPCPSPYNNCEVSARPCPSELCGPMCSPFKKRRYVQPPRRESCKPMIRYQAPSIPMANDTVYRQSFDCIDSQTAASCRLPPVRPFGTLRTNQGQFEKETVTRLSYQPYCPVERTKPIYPYSPSLLGQGPMQGLTTQKHDFVPKFQYRRTKVVPVDNIKKGCGCIEKNTVNRMSFMRPDTCNYTRVVSCKPIISYKRPDMPMEFETTQKLSYMPVCPQVKDDLPWARRPKYCRPTLKFEKDTVTSLSFMPPGCFLENSQCCCDVPFNAPRAAC